MTSPKIIEIERKIQRINNFSAISSCLPRVRSTAGAIAALGGIPTLQPMTGQGGHFYFRIDIMRRHKKCLPSDIGDKVTRVSVRTAPAFWCGR